MNPEQRHIIAAFTGALDALDQVLENVSEDRLDWSEKEEGWSIRQVIHHLTDDCDVYAMIIKRALAIPGCKQFFTGFPGNEAWANALDFDSRPIQPARDLMHAHRAYIAEIVSRFPDRWENTILYYNEAGEKITERTIQQLLESLTEHMQEHTQMIEQILNTHA